VLREGGTATDAAVAVAAALGVTEPYSAGIGGGGYFVHYDAETGEVETNDGRETAPRSAAEDMFLENGQPIPFDEAVTSGLSGGGGEFFHDDAETGEVGTMDGRETAPRSAAEDMFVENGQPIPFDEAVTSGLSVGVPGTPLTWQHALDKWGTKSLSEVLRPAEQ